jgi:hypothetical protein
MRKTLIALVLAVTILSYGQMAHGGEGHDAGYEWAQEHDITDTSYSNGNSESFNEGVRQYAEEQQGEE